MKYILSFFLALCVCNLSTAQSGEIIPSLGLETAIPIGDISDIASFGLGASVGAEYTLSDETSLDLQAGFISFFTSADNSSYNMFPVQAGFRYYLNDFAEGIYLKAGLGFHTQSVKNTIPAVEVLGVVVSPEQEIKFSTTDFSVAPTAGYKIGHWDLSLRYTTILSDGDSAAYIGFRGAYLFGANY